MSTYDYKCNTNGELVEVKHDLSELSITWADLCERSGYESSDTPVTHLANGGQIVKRSNMDDSVLQGCDAGPRCGGRRCG